MAARHWLFTSPLTLLPAQHVLLLVFVTSVHIAGSFSLTLPNKAISIGQAIQIAESAQDLLEVASSIWLPTDTDLPQHLLSQKVHHEKRQRWSAQLLEKLGTVYDASQPYDDARLTRAILGASIPFESDRSEKEGVYVQQALLGIHCMFGNLKSIKLSDEAQIGIRQLMRRAIVMAPSMKLSTVVEIRWAIRGLLARMSTEESVDLSILDDLVSELPFDILPLGLDWNKIVAHDSVLATLRNDIPFNFDTIVTRTGAIVTERRATTWLAEPDIGALAYSGKLMTPHPIPSVVVATMREVERALGDDFDHSYFNCALCNHYPGGDAACKFHTDPEHGTFWERLTCVVAAGQERRFAFRPIPGTTTWNEWETIDSRHSINSGEAANAPAVIHLFSGDIVKMWGPCNDDFYHAVFTAEGDSDKDERVSLVLKRAMNRGNGKRGHGLAGEGRRSKRRSQGEGGVSSQQQLSKARRPKPQRS